MTVLDGAVRPRLECFPAVRLGADGADMADL
jgi:hypothetical protein